MASMVQTSNEPISAFRVKHAEYEKYLNALLADLQNTISPVTQSKQSHPQTVNGANSYTTQQYPNNNSTYGSIKKPSVNFDESQIEKSQPSNSPSHYQQQPNQFRQQHSPTYQNSSVMPDTSLNNSLSELDNLLSDLGSAVTHPSNKNAISANHFGNAIENHINNVISDISNSVNGNNSKQLMYIKKETKTEKTLQGHPSEMAHSTESYTSTNNNQLDSVPSSATKELDALMASLSDIKINDSNNWQNQQQISYAQSKPKQATQSKNLTCSDDFEEDNHLDFMLGNLKADMSRQGINTAQKGCCSACDKPIVGQVITALGKTWHPEHFTCTHCTQELGTKNFFERDGQPYCETDYHNLFSPRCAYCNGPILDKCVTALEKTWHTEHFFCAQCGKQFGEEGFHEKNGKPYCRDDYFDMFAPKCKACNRAITENYISALNGQWHANCFVCRDCHLPFLGGSFFDHEGQPYCETHYHAQRGSLCGGCHKPITGRCITAMFRKFHPEHFVCAFCLKQLNKGTFKEHNDKPYCHVCFEKLFG